MTLRPSSQRLMLLPMAIAAAALMAACGAGSDPAPTATTESSPADTGRETAAGVATTTLPVGRYVLVNALSGKCVDVAGASRADGGNIQQATCNTNLAQVFDVTQTSGGVYKLLNVGSGKAVDVSASSTVSPNAASSSPTGSPAGHATV